MQSYDDHRQLLSNESIDGVVIAAPPQTHMDLIADCLDAGMRFVFCEKPLTINRAETDAIRRQAHAAGAIVLEGFMYRYHPQIAAVCELIASGELGAVDHVSCSINMLDELELGTESMPAQLASPVCGRGSVARFSLLPG